MSDVNISGELRSINQSIYELGSEISDAKYQVGKVHADLNTTYGELKELREAFDRFVLEAERVANIQRAETKLGTLKAELDRQYGHYAVVRRTSVGTLQAFDVGNVSTRVIRNVSEELMIQTPRYWLAPALVALSAWARDDENIARKSVEEAFNRDPHKTSLFFTLVLRRQNRFEEAVRWLRQYLNTCDPWHLTREFGVILEGAAQGAFGPEGAKVAGEQLTKWQKYLREKDEVKQRQVDLWIREITVHREHISRYDYQELSQFCQDWEQVKSQAEAARALAPLAEKYAGVKDSHEGEIALIVDLFDDLLDMLVTEYDEEELPLRREVAFNEAIIEKDGNMDEAQVLADLSQEYLEETIDAVTLQTHAAISPSSIGCSRRTQRIAVGTCLGDFRSALSKYTADYRSRQTEVGILKFDQNHSNYANRWNFVGYTCTTADDEEECKNGLAHAWLRTFHNQLEAAKYKPRALIIAGILLFFWFMLWAMAGVAAFGFISTLICAGAVAIWQFPKFKEADRRTKEILAEKNRAFSFSFQLLVDCQAQFLELLLAYETEDANEAEVLRVLDTWPTGVENKEEA